MIAIPNVSMEGMTKPTANATTRFRAALIKKTRSEVVSLFRHSGETHVRCGNLRTAVVQDIHEVGVCWVKQERNLVRAKDENLLISHGMHMVLITYTDAVQPTSRTS